MSIGYFQWTKIGCFRWTRSGSFRRTLTLLQNIFWGRAVLLSNLFKNFLEVFHLFLSSIFRISTRSLGRVYNLKNVEVPYTLSNDRKKDWKSQ